MLSDRQKLILKAIIEEYVTTNEPVGSKALTEKPYLTFSSATLRYEMQHLEEEGYLEERNMLAAGFYSHMKEMYPVYMEKEGSDKRMIMDYVAGMTDNFCLDCANEILKPEHLNDEINQSQTGKWFDVRRR